MLTLRVTQTTIGTDRFRVEVALHGPGPARRTATTEFDSPVTSQDREDLRWYLEDYLQHIADPAPSVAARIEHRITALGVSLFRALFTTSDDARDLWASVRDQLSDVRVELVTELRAATAVPWELCRDPKTDAPLALRAGAFVHAVHQAAEHPQIRPPSDGPIRILLVISRPLGGADVPFRSVASRLLKAGVGAGDAFELSVLRPATFEQLSKELRAARRTGRPYHIVHFDGHGVYQDVSHSRTARDSAPTRLLASSARTGSHGYLLFENPGIDENLQLVDGPRLGRLLVEADVPVLVVNACRSAHAESPAVPEVTENGPAGAAPERSSDVHAQARALGSLAQEVADAGVAGVVAMRYNVYVVTAAAFLAELYDALVAGQTLGEAVTLGRKQLDAQPLRQIAYEPRRLQDWMVPIVYEGTPVSLFPKTSRRSRLRITLDAGSAAPSSSELAPQVQRLPDAGFFGRDETLLALDRAFDTQTVVLLHGFAGSGKTSTAAEFARWYRLTGGITGPVLFTSFEQHRTLSQILNEAIGGTFAVALERSGVNWLALTDDQRRDVSLQVMTQVPMLWIWDNVEPIAGFPAGRASAWSADEQSALTSFLRAATSSRAKFLLTSRRDERGWLGDLPARIAMPPMPMQERVLLAQALAQKHGRRLAEVDHWIPLLGFAGGNPLTITVLMSQALRARLTTAADIEAFVARLRTGASEFADEAAEGRDKSLGASLSYGFDHAFTDVERHQLSLLHLFQGVVEVDVLRLMGAPDTPWCLPELRGITTDAAASLLDRASEVGLLTPLGHGCYTVHPALPWFFHSLFDRYHSSPAGGSEAARAFVAAMGLLASHYHVSYSRGATEAVSALLREEANLIHARQLARKNGWWSELIGIMQGLRAIYTHTARRAEWAALVGEIVPDFVSPDTDGPLPGRAAEWRMVTEYRVQLALAAREWSEAERLLRVQLALAQDRAEAALTQPNAELGVDQRNDLRNLAVSFELLGTTLRAQGDPACIDAYEQAIRLYRRTGERTAESVASLNIGHAYVSVPGLRDLALAERHYADALNLCDEKDKHGRARALGSMGRVALERAKESGAADQDAERLTHLRVAVAFYADSLKLLPVDAIADLAVTHNQLGNINSDLGSLDLAMQHWRDAIRFEEAAGDVFEAARTRFNAALGLARGGALADAMDYARAALRGFSLVGSAGDVDLDRCRELVTAIQSAMTSSTTGR